jgi:hypothetical protein
MSQATLRRSVLLSACVGLLFGGLLLGAVCACESEEDRVLGLVDTLAQELPQKPGESEAERSRRINARVAPALAEDVEIVAPWLDTPGDKAFALNAATQLNQAFPVADLELTSTDVGLSPSGKRAAVSGVARVSGSQARDLHGFDVQFELDLKKESSLWRLARVTLKQPSRDLPEARP